MPTFDQSLNTRLTTDGDILTRVAGLPARVTRAALAADAAFTGAFVPFVGAQGNADVGVGGTALARLHVKESTDAEVSRFEGNGQGHVNLYDGATKRGTVGFGSAGHIFTNGLTNSVNIRSEEALQLGVDSTVALTIREVGYTPGSGYIAVGGHTDPLSVFEVGGEASPELGIRSTTAGTGKRWTLASWTDGRFLIIDRGTPNVERMEITTDGSLKVTSGDKGIVFGTAARMYAVGTTVYARNAADSAYVGIDVSAATIRAALAHVGTTVGFYNTTPVVQGAAVADATDAASAITQLNALLARIRATGLIAT